ncbi:MAG: LON peptidase substrate-binding domain-containing protein [Rickettsiales bacterium]|nr:LON peptidase substrate-binding domain-containing protein [Rickettsiales bacterium]
MQTKIVTNKFESLPKKLLSLIDDKSTLLPGEEIRFKSSGKNFRNIVDCSFKLFDRYIAVSQTIKDLNNIQIATVGKIIEFSESNDSNYTIIVEGIIRFRINDQKKYNDNLTILYPDYSKYEDDLLFKDFVFNDRENINDLVYEYLNLTNNNEIDENKLIMFSDIKLISFISNQLKFNKYKKQKLLYAQNSNEIDNFIANTLNLEIALIESRQSAKH